MSKYLSALSERCSDGKENPVLGVTPGFCARRLNVVQIARTKLEPRFHRGAI